MTVPAIWKPAAKQFMREAAYQVKYCLKYFSDRQSEPNLYRVNYLLFIYLVNWLEFDDDITHIVVMKLIFAVRIKQTGFSCQRSTEFERNI